MAKPLLIGAHTSAAGGVFQALIHGKRIGATTIQLFTANQKQWTPKVLTDEMVAKWQETLMQTGLQEIMSHDSYLINLGCPDLDNLTKSRTAFALEIDRCLRLGITYLNFHPGAALTQSVEGCLDRIVESLRLVKPALKQGNLRLLLEATAGQGSTVGWRFEELAYLIQRLQDDIPIGVCIDTCHIFAAGYDLRTPEACDATLKEFDRIVGLQHLYALHLNDSLKPLGSRVDRHSSLGQGYIGLEAFRYLMCDPRTAYLPKYLETPEPEKWPEEIQLLRSMASSCNFCNNV